MITYPINRLMYSALLLIAFFYPVIAGASEADVIAAEAEPMGGDFYRISVTVRHQDEGWEHYVTGWEVLDMEGRVLGVRGLRHPHVNEQPFTRAATVIIPAHIEQVRIRAYDSTHNYGGNELILLINKEITGDE